MKWWIICGCICTFLGSYQIVNTILDFIEQKKGAQLDKLSAEKAFASLSKDSGDSKLEILYCAADWIDLKKTESYGLTPLDVILLAYWIEILSGEHGRLYDEGQQMWSEINRKPHVSKSFSSNNDLDPRLRRTLYYLHALETSDSETWLDAMHNFFNTTGHDVFMTVESNGPFNYKKPSKEYIQSRMESQDLHLYSNLENHFGHLNAENARKMLLELAFNPLINQTYPEIEIRHGQVCFKIRLNVGVKMEVMLKKQMTVRAERRLQSHEDVEKHSVFPAGVHISAYTGGMIPVIGGDEDTQYRILSAIPCFTGGYVLRRNPVADKRPSFEAKPSSLGYNCANKCVDAGDDIDALWEMLYALWEARCTTNKTCKRALEKDSDFSNNITHRNTLLPDGSQNIGCGSRMSDTCANYMCAMNEYIKGGACASTGFTRADVMKWANYRDLRFSQMRQCGKYLIPLELNRRRQFGKRLTISMYAFNAKIYKMLSTRSSQCVENPGTDELQPIYQRSEKCVATCRDNVLFDNCTSTALLFEDFDGPDKCKLPLCKIKQFWKGLEGLEDPLKSKALEKCINECKKIAPLCNTATTSLVPLAETHKKYSTDSTLYNYHKLIITATDVEVTTEFLQLPWGSFVANTGGLLGFFLGMSLLQWCLWPFEGYAYLRKRYIMKQASKHQTEGM